VKTPSRHGVTRSAFFAITTGSVLRLPHLCSGTHCRTGRYSPMGDAKNLEELIARNRALIAEAAELRADVQRKRLQMRTTRRSSRQRQPQVDIETLKKRALEARMDAAERVVTARSLLARLTRQDGAA
jgi:hypothetical protein